MAVPIADTHVSATRAPPPGMVWRSSTAWGSNGSALSCRGRCMAVVVRAIASSHGSYGRHSAWRRKRWVGVKWPVRGCWS